jgi:hypothetical protein
MNQIEKATSFKKIFANRENAKRSTGPRSVEGKSFSRRNALKHGLRADNKAEFEEFNLAMIKELKPFDMISMQIVNRIIVVAWNLQRSDKIQSGIFAYEIQTYEADEYKSKLKEINCADFNGLEKKVPKQNLLLGLSFLRDSNSGDAMSKLGAYKNRLLNRFSKLREELNIYKEQHGKR